MLSASVPWRPILISPPVSPVGYFGVSQIAFTNPFAGNVTGLKIVFAVYDAALFKGDRITLQLPGFTGGVFTLSSEHASLSDPADAVDYMTWNPESQEMKIYTLRDFKRNQIVSVMF